MTWQEISQFVSDHREAIAWLAGGSVLAFVVSIVVLPLILVRLPADYFVRDPGLPRHHPFLRLVLRILKNLLGVLLLVLGFIMLFIPGQGILTMLFGVALTDFPGKRRLQTRIACTPRVRRTLDWLRHKTDRPLFILPDS